MGTAKLYLDLQSVAHCCGSSPHILFLITGLKAGNHTKSWYLAEKGKLHMKNEKKWKSDRFFGNVCVYFDRIMPIIVHALCFSSFFLCFSLNHFFSFFFHFFHFFLNFFHFHWHFQKSRWITFIIYRNRCDRDKITMQIAKIDQAYTVSWRFVMHRFLAQVSCIFLLFTEICLSMWAISTPKNLFFAFYKQNLG